MSRNVRPSHVAILVAVVVAFTLGFVLRGGGDGADADHHGHRPGGDADAAPVTWTCSMHPQFQLPEPGECPICFMDLIPLEEDDSAGLGPRDLVLSDAAAALAEIATAPVQRRFAVRELTLVGKVAADETRQRVITARIPGRIERLYADFTGRQVRRGEKLAEIYSPELYQARAELESAREAVRRGDPGAAANLHSVEERLRLWDLDPDQIADATGDRITITAPLAGTVVSKDAVEGAYLATGQPIVTIADLDRVWVELDAFERDLVWLARGQTVSFTVTALPGEQFEGSIEFVDPLLDDRTRTIRARLEVDNRDGRLRPGMLARGRVLAELAADGRPRAGRDAVEAPLVVPATAPLLTGERAVVYVRLPGEEPRFRGVDVVLGPRAGDWFVLRDGLEEGDLVVINGAFKLDSALQIQARTSMMLPASAAAEPDLPDVPPCFANLAPAVVEAYLGLQASLAGDDDGAAAAAASRLQGVFRDHCREAIPDLVAAAETVAAAADISARRIAFQPLSDILWRLVAATGWQGDTILRRFHCPMAFDDAGAHWLQFDETTANPYYGAMMLRCGLEVDRLDSGEGGL